MQQFEPINPATCISPHFRRTVRAKGWNGTENPLVLLSKQTPACKNPKPLKGIFMIKNFVGMICFLLFGSGIAAAANGQDISGLAERVELLEMQARSHGVPVPPMPIPNAPKRLQVAQNAGNLAVRVDRLESQMRQYTGQMEEMNFRIRQLQEQLRRFQEDSEFRFQDLEKGKKRRKSSNAKPKSPSFEQLGAPPKSLGSLAQDQLTQAPAIAAPAGTGSGPIDLSSILTGGGQQQSSTDNSAFSGTVATLTGDPATDYDMAYGYVLQGDYKNAEAAFREFVLTYGTSNLVPNARYWVGESLFQQQNYRKAIEEFLDAYSQYPTAKKAPDMLLKTGMSLRQIGEREAACATYEELLSKFPGASGAVRRKVRSEIKSAKC